MTLTPKNVIVSAVMIRILLIYWLSCYETAQHLTLTDHILRMRIIVIRPTQKLIRKIADVSALQTDPTADLARSKFLKEAESAYETARSQPLLVAVSYLIFPHLGVHTSNDLVPHAWK